MPGAVANLVRPTRRSRAVRVEAAPQPFAFDPARAALIVIDMQNDFLSPGGWFHSRGIDLAAARSVIAPINRTAAAARKAGMPVVWLNWGNRPDLLNLPHGVLRGGAYGKRLARGRVLERGSWGAAIVPELNVSKNDIHIEKYRLSGFWDSQLDSILRRLDVTALLFAGVNLDRCVLATMQDASFIGYDVILLDDCSATVSPDFCAEAARFLLRKLYGFVTQSAEVIEALSKRRPKN